MSKVEELTRQIAEQGIDPENIDATAIDLTPRERLAWEQAVGSPLGEFSMVAQTVMLAWWEARQQGRELTPDEALDLPGSEADELALEGMLRLGKTGGEPEPPASPTPTGSETSPYSDTTTGSPSPS